MKQNDSGSALFLAGLSGILGLLVSNVFAEEWIDRVVQGGETGNGYLHGQYPSWGDRTHPGIDIGGGCELKVTAPAHGAVVRVVDIDDPRYSSVGNAVVLQHMDGEEAIFTAYLHLKAAPLVKNGPVSAGQIIGYTGDTGFAKGCHLHFEVRRFDGIDRLFHPEFKNIYLSGDQRKDASFRNDWIDPLVWLSDLPAHEKRQSAPDLSNEASLELIDETGNVVSLNGYHTPISLVHFGYASSPDICPTTLLMISDALRRLGDQASDITTLFISVDPKRDTPARLKEYTSYFHTSIVGLTGSHDQLVKAAEAFDTKFGYSLFVDGQERPIDMAEYELLDGSSTYSASHSSHVYIVGANGDLLDVILPYGRRSSVSLIESRLRELLDSRK